MQNPKNPEGKDTVGNVLSNKRGSGYIMWTVMIAVLCMILSCILSYVMSVTLITGQKDIAKNILDKQLSSNSVQIFQNVKEQDDYTNREFTSTYIADLVRVCDLTALNATQYESKTDSGETRYVITVPTVTYEEDFAPKLVVKYTITVPVEFAGIRAVWVDVPVTIVSRFNSKFDVT